MSIEFTTPVGRLVQGSVYEGQDKGADGKPNTIKNGPNTGQPKTTFYFAVAIPKSAEQHWAQTEWGAKIWGEGHKSFPQQAQGRGFAWKITDGDSTEYNAANPPRRPCDTEGFKGHWILRFSSGFAPKLYDRTGSKQLVEPGAIKCGYYVQVYCSVAGNGQLQKPGVYLNHQMVSLSAYGPEIVSAAADPSVAGFGAAPLPAGALATPVGGFAPAPAAAQVQQYQPPPPVMQATNLPVYAPPVQPNSAFLAVPGHPAPPVAGMPPPPPPPPVAAGPQMLPAAGGASYAQMVAAGWTDDQMRAHKMMV